ncbi:MAG: pentapeptide repeat-containing protein [Bacteroidaceae bacterium]|nr:pentapeptide repeat-containing protein [Bacteroidaceae bacterium]
MFFQVAGSVGGRRRGGFLAIESLSAVLSGAVLSGAVLSGAVLLGAVLLGVASSSVDPSRSGPIHWSLKDVIQAPLCLPLRG